MVNLVYLRLKNFTWLDVCLNKNEIVIDRYDSPNNMCVILANNGSGKSSLLMEMTPYPLEHTISRSTKRTEKDKIAEKEIHFVLETGIRYKCKIYYDKNKTSAYITKDDMINGGEEIELNINGNIGSYEEILEKELGITKNYQQIGFLSPDLINFISMKAADRSRYLSNFLPDVSFFLKSYDIVSKKANEKKREIENLNKELGKLTTINYETHLEQLKLNIELTNKSLDKLKEDSVKCKMFLDSFDQYQEAMLQKDKIKQLFLMYSNDADKLKNKIYLSKEYLDFYKGKDGDKRLKEDILKLEKDLVSSREREYSLGKNIEKLILSIKEKEMLLDDNSNLSQDSLSDILNYIDKYTQELEELNKELVILESSNSLMIELFDKMDINQIYDFNRISELILELSSRLERINDSNIFNLKYLSNKTLELERLFSGTKNDIEENEKEIKDLNEKISLLHSNEEMKRLYSLREKCVKSCRIIQELEKYVNIDNERELLIKNKSLLEDKINNDKKKLEKYELDITIINQNLTIITNINNIIMQNSNNIAEYSEKIKVIFKYEEVEDIVKELRKIKINFEPFKEYVHLKEKIKSINNSLNELKIKKNVAISKSNIQKEVEELNNNKKELEILKSETIVKLETEIERLKDISKNKESIQNDIFDYELLTKELLDVKSKLITLANIEYYSSHLKDISIKLELDKAFKEKELSNLEKERELLKSEYLNKQQLEKLRNQYLEIKNRYEILKSIWSVRDGYPSILLESFLLELKNDVNKNLNEIWDNSLSIEDFILTQSEFSIVMNRSGTIIADASQLSQGERAIMSLAISFSIIEMNLKEKMYDVIRLDELDATLDEIRSRRFFEMVKERIERMGVSSCFIISHRSEFESVSADLILLRGAKVENISNKNIIFKI